MSPSTLKSHFGFTASRLNFAIVAVVGCLASILHFVSTSIAAESRPNVVFILADDLGWSDTTLYESTRFYKTPNIERLAARGMTFTHAYSCSPLCSPTRASILTGLSPARTGITAPVCHLPNVLLRATSSPTAAPNQKSTQLQSATRLTTDHYTLGEMFKDNGYATGHFGKWHLGAEPYSPLQHGFDVDIPHWHGPGPAGSYVAPWKFVDFDPQTPDEHIEDRMAKEAVAFMEVHKDKPFFLNYWMFSVHAPFDAKRSLIDEYKSTADPNDPQRSPTYAAMVHSLDDAVGTLLDTLDRLKIADRTIIVFATDNGGNMYSEVDGTTATSNAPLRGGKATMYEGGIRGPAIVAYPPVIKPGSRSDQVIQSSDYYPTLLELLAINPQSGQTFDGISIVPALQGKLLGRQAIFTYFPHAPAIPDWLPPSVCVHQGDWKLIRIFHGGENGSHRYKLFNLRDDVGERSDLAKTFPDRVKSMDELIESFLVATEAVRPLPNPNFDPSKYRPELEGAGSLKRSADGPPRKAARSGAGQAKRGKPVAGWQPAGDCSIAVDGDELVVTSTGNDPQISFPFPEPLSPRPLTLRFTMQSDSSGKGQVFWHQQGIAPAFFRDRSVSFPVAHDGQSHSYAIELPTEGRVLAIRMDPSSRDGVIRLRDLHLTADDGKVVYRWKLD